MYNGVLKQIKCKIKKIVVTRMQKCSSRTRLRNEEGGGGGGGDKDKRKEIIIFSSSIGKMLSYFNRFAEGAIEERKNQSGGYPEKLLVKSKCTNLDKFLCAIKAKKRKEKRQEKTFGKTQRCGRVSKNPILSGCPSKHFGCEECIRQYSRDKTEMVCPQCNMLVRAEHNDKYLQAHSDLKREMDEKVVIKCLKCKTDEMKLGDYETHLRRECRQAFVACDHCHIDKIRRKDLQSHIDHCDMVVIECPLTCGYLEIYYSSKISNSYYCHF
ncbi:hypothetical protein RFI_27867, partial [Reticulomyxa filosa]